MRKPTRETYQRLEIFYQAASTKLTASMQEYSAILMTGDPQDRECARDRVIFATEAFLDIQEELTFCSLSLSGIDPYTRHIGPDTGHV